MDNSYGNNIDVTDPSSPDGNGMVPTKGGVPRQAPPAHKHHPQKESHAMGAYPIIPASSDCIGTTPTGVCGPCMN